MPGEATLGEQRLIDGHLRELRSPGRLRRLLADLNYRVSDEPVSTADWNPELAKTARDGSLRIVARHQDFVVTYCNLQELRLGLEREVVTKLVRQYDRGLFAFSDLEESHWHLVNVKRDSLRHNRLVLRRIAIGPEEQLRTAIERISLLKVSDVSWSGLQVELEHEEAFDVEKVTKEFFREYARIFERVEQLIQGFTEPERKRLFTQQLFNRLMFIAFIQKKGWLKFDSQTNYLSALWNTYGRDASSKTNFYGERLHPLFFSGLSTPNEVNVIDINRGGFLRTLIGDVPYLNGGLFEEDEDDRNPEVVVPDECTEAILTGVFDRFNFTVTESTPLDIEVAVDPEMLGKVFEELVTGRHETGSYYTPKPVVSFMGREALKGYLKTVLPSESSVAIEQFVEERDPAGLRNPEAVLEALRRIRVCDLACGSGAYLLGMLHELLDLRTCLFATRNLDPISTYERKLEIIQNNLYGVDLDPFAVNVARLRLWLSLAVEFEGLTPPPLPNLDFKIETGDSLTAPDPSIRLQHSFRQQQIEDYFRLKGAYMTAHGGEKLTLREQITALQADISAWTHGGKPVAGFDWPVEFAEVFADGGFDVVLTNPPYVRQELIHDLKPTLQKIYPTVYMGTADLYCYFYARALQLLRPGRMIVFISSNKWFRANYGKRLRKHIGDTCHIYSITDFGDLPVFKSATAYPMIFVAQKAFFTEDDEKIKKETSPILTEPHSLEPPYPDVLALIRMQGRTLARGGFQGEEWSFSNETTACRVAQMKEAGIPLDNYVNGLIFRGLTTGFNNAFVITQHQRDTLVETDSKSSEYIKPYFRGRDIKRWVISYPDLYIIHVPWDFPFNAQKAIANHLEQFKEELSARPEVLEGRFPWFAMSRYGADYYHYFDYPKIVAPDIASEPRFAFDLSGAYLGNTAYIIPVKDLFLLGVLNSTSVTEYYTEVSSQVRGGYLRFIRQYIEKIPIPSASQEKKEAISLLVKRCLDSQGENCQELENEINERVATLYER